MVRFLVALWLSPIVLFAAWVSLSSLDWHMGFAFMTRDMHDRIFAAYAMVFGIEREAILGMIRNALLLDAAVLALIVAWQRRAPIRRAWAGLRERAAPFLVRFTHGLRA